VTVGTVGRVLVVDDEEPLARLVAEYLTRDGFAVSLAFDGAAAVGAARSETPDVVVLDLGLPGLDGIEVCRQLRTFTDCYVLMLTARTDEVDKLIGLSVGADDYMTKPFSPRELVARVHVLLRRPRQPAAGNDGAGALLRFGRLEIDVAAREVRVDSRLVELTRTEFDVLAALAARPRVVFNRRQLVDAVWGAGWFGDEHLVDVHIGHLRRKLGDDAEEGRFVRTVRGVGYRMGDRQ
jgi:DNA-binding response OmpR family regulator